MINVCQCYLLDMYSYIYTVYICMYIYLYILVIIETSLKVHIIKFTTSFKLLVEIMN